VLHARARTREFSLAVAVFTLVALCLTVFHVRPIEAHDAHAGNGNAPLELFDHDTIRISQADSKRRSGRKGSSKKGSSKKGSKKDDDKTAEANDAPEFDRVVLKLGPRASKHSGRIIDITKTSIVMESWRGRHSIPRPAVNDIQRIADEKAIGVFNKFRKKAKDKKRWKKLLDFARKNELRPEERECHRELLKFGPENEEHLAGIGKRLYKGKWIDESQVLKLLRGGYKIEGNELVRDASRSNTESDDDGDGSKSKKKSTKKRRNPKDIKALDHVGEAIVHRNAHSLWMLLARSAVMALPEARERLNLASCEEFIERLEKLGDYSFRMGSFLDEVGAPIDWVETNKVKVKKFLEKHGEDAIHLKTKYYHVLSTMDPKMTREFGQKMDLVTKYVYQKIFEFEEKIPYRYVVRIYANQREYNKNGGPPMAGAHYEPYSKELVGYPKKGDETWGLDTFKSLFHEGWHQYFDFYIPNAPRWFDEGFAEIASPVTFKGGKAKMNAFNPGRHQYLLRVKQVNKLIPLDELIRMSHQEFYQPNVVGISYAQAWSFIYFLTNFKHKNAKTQKRIRSFYKDYFWELHRGTDPVKACDIVFKDVKFHALERAWRDSIAHQK